MKKLLPLLALALYPTYTLSQGVRGAEIEMIAPYQHAKVKEVGDRMPKSMGEPITVLDLYVLNSEGVRGAIRQEGKIYGFDRNPEDRKNISEYEFLVRDCDKNRDVKIYAAYDVPHKLLYIDSSRDRHIDSIVELDSILNAILPMIPVCKKDIRT